MKKIIPILLFAVLLFLTVLYFTRSTFSGKRCMHIKLDKIFILTLDTGSERYINFKNSYTLDIPLEIILGVNTKNPENTEKYRSIVEPERFNNMYLYDKGLAQRKNHTYFNSGALGCYLGHMEFYKRCFSQNLKYALIFEDNVVLKDGFENELKNLLLPSNFDICFLHTFRYLGKETNDCGDKLVDMKWVNGTKAYIINVENMKKYYYLFFPIDNHIDRIYEKLVLHGCKMYFKNFKSINISTRVSTIRHTGIIDEDKEFFYLNGYTNKDIVILD